MDVNSLISNKKHCSGKGYDKRITMICGLPDEILALIISSLPAIEAIRTSVLSKRWVHLWRRISKIELKEGRPETRQQFIDYVRRLLAISDCFILEKFSLSCKVGEDAAQVNEWLSGFINPKIQELNLVLKGIETPLVFPNHLFTCTKLTKFQLSMQHVLELPSFIHFGSLKTLTLENVILPASSSTQLFFSGSPSLEELTLINCNWVNVKNVYISSVFRKLIIMEWQDDDNKPDEDIGGQNVSHHCEVVIVGTKSLKSFAYDGVCTNDYFLYNSASLINASILVQILSELGTEREKHAGKIVLRLLKALPNVKKLSISDISLWVWPQY